MITDNNTFVTTITSVFTFNRIKKLVSTYIENNHPFIIIDEDKTVEFKIENNVYQTYQRRPLPLGEG